MRCYLKELRENKKMSQTQVADQLSMTQQYYSYIENGDRQQDMGLSLLQKIAEVFNVPLAELIESEKTFQQSIKATETT